MSTIKSMISAENSLNWLKAASVEVQHTRIHIWSKAISSIHITIHNNNNSLRDYFNTIELHPNDISKQTKRQYSFLHLIVFENTKKSDPYHP